MAKSNFNDIGGKKSVEDILSPEELTLSIQMGTYKTDGQLADEKTKKDAKEFAFAQEHNDGVSSHDVTKPRPPKM